MYQRARAPAFEEFAAGRRRKRAAQDTDAAVSANLREDDTYLSSLLAPLVILSVISVEVLLMTYGFIYPTLRALIDGAISKLPLDSSTSGFLVRLIPTALQLANQGVAYLSVVLWLASFTEAAIFVYGVVGTEGTWKFGWKGVFRALTARSLHITDIGIMLINGPVVFTTTPNSLFRSVVALRICRLADVVSLLMEEVRARGVLMEARLLEESGASGLLRAQVQTLKESLSREETARAALETSHRRLETENEELWESLLVSAEDWQAAGLDVGEGGVLTRRGVRLTRSQVGGDSGSVKSGSRESVKRRGGGHNPLGAASSQQQQQQRPGTVYVPPLPSRNDNNSSTATSSSIQEPSENPRISDTRQRKNGALGAAGAAAAVGTAAAAPEQDTEYLSAEEEEELQ